MANELTPVQRLDMVAKAIKSPICLRRLRWITAIGAGLLIVGAVLTPRTSPIALPVYVAAAAVVLAAAIARTDGRFNILGASVMVAGALVAVAAVREGIERSFLPLLFSGHFWNLFVLGWRHARVHEDGWESERERIAHLFAKLTTEGATDVVEFTTSSFWHGHWTFRLHNPGGYWVVGKFAKGKNEVIELRVRELSEVVFTPTASGKWNVEFVNREEQLVWRNVEMVRQLPSV